jgi:voltage-gated potassium channel
MVDSTRESGREGNLASTKIRQAAHMGKERGRARDPEQRLHHWEHLTSYPLTLLSIFFIAVYAWPILEPGLDDHWRSVCEIGDLLIWGVFCIEYVARLLLSVNKIRFVRTHWFDLSVLILPVLRPLRALRLLNALRVLNRHAVSWTRGRLALYVIATTVLIVLMAGLAVLEAERGHPHSNIESYPQALWWAICTITTVGYGDFYPQTVEGRMVALALMIGGLGLIGFTTGSMASWIIDRLSDSEHPSRAATRADIVLLLHEVRKLRAEVAELKGQQSEPTELERHEPEQSQRH